MVTLRLYLRNCKIAEFFIYYLAEMLIATESAVS